MNTDDLLSIDDFKEFDSTELIVLANGIQLSGFSKDEFINVTPIEPDAYKFTTGLNSTIMSKTTNKNYTMNLKFLQSASGSKFLKSLKGKRISIIVMDPSSKEEFLNSTTSIVYDNPSMKRGEVAHQDGIVKIMLIKPIFSFVS